MIMKTTDEEMQILRHSLGLAYDGSGQAMYRDYYCDNVPCSAEMDSLVEKGLMVRGRKINDGQSQYFHVTEAGKKLAYQPAKKLPKAKRVYRAFLDLDMGISFREFITHPDFAEYRKNC